MKGRLLLSAAVLSALSLPAMGSEMYSKVKDVRLNSQRTVIHFEGKVQDVIVLRNSSGMRSAEVRMEYWSNSEIRHILRNFYDRTFLEVRRGMGRHNRGMRVLVANRNGQAAKPRAACTEFKKRLFRRTRVQGVCLAAQLSIPSGADYRFVQTVGGRGTTIEVMLPSRPVPPRPPHGGQFISEYEMNQMIQQISYESFDSNRVNIVRNYMSYGKLIRGFQVERLISGDLFSFDSNKLEVLRIVAGKLVLQSEMAIERLISVFRFQMDQREARRILNTRRRFDDGRGGARWERYP